MHLQIRGSLLSMLYDLLINLMSKHHGSSKDIISSADSYLYFSYHRVFNEHIILLKSFFKFP